MRAGIARGGGARDGAREAPSGRSRSTSPTPTSATWLEPRLAHLLGLAERTAPDREDLFSAWRLFFERLAEQGAGRARLRGPPVGRRGPARLHRVPARVVAQPPAVRARARAARSSPSGGRRSAPAAATRRTLSLEPLSERGDGAAARRASSRACPTSSGRRSSPAPRASRSTRSRRCGCCSTVACSPARATSTGRPGRSRRSTSPRRCTRSSPHASTASSRRSGGCCRTPPCSASRSRRPALVGAFRASRAELEPLLTSLVRKEVLSVQADPRSPERGQYSFLQDLLKRVAYETLAKAERKSRHLAAAGHLDAGLRGGRAGDRRGDRRALPRRLPARRRTRTTRTRSGSKAQETLTRAGERAASLAANEEAAALLRAGRRAQRRPARRGRASRARRRDRLGLRSDGAGAARTTSVRWGCTRHRA